MNARLGELDLSTEEDCDIYGEEKVCSEPPVDVEVNKIIAHKEYNKDNLKNDIALVNTKQKMIFTGNKDHLIRFWLFNFFFVGC